MGPLEEAVPPGPSPIPLWLHFFIFFCWLPASLQKAKRAISYKGIVFSIL